MDWSKKVLLGAFIFFVLCVMTSFALIAHGQVPIQCSAVKPCSVFWTANTEPDLKDYRVWVRQLPAPYGTTPLLTITKPQSAMSAGQFMGAIGTLTAGQYALAVSARDTSLNESAKSMEVFFEFVDITPPIPPTLQIISVSIP